MRSYRLFAPIAVAGLVLDQLTKMWARASLTPGRDTRVVDGVWIHRLAFNTGSAFSMFQKVGGTRVVLSAIALAACVAMVVYVGRTARRASIIAAGLIFAGALGNAIDRMRTGAVTDFVVWKAGGHEWPAFNVADALLLAGVAVLMIWGGSARAAKHQAA